MVRRHTPCVAAFLAAFLFHGLTWRAAAAETYTAAWALGFTPVQPNAPYDRPPKDEYPQCTIRAERQANVTSWVVRSGQGEILRRFSDTNSDNVVDQWCYFQGGLESYRDVDSDFNKKADQYRWFYTSGTRWGIDKNEDGRIDYWNVISAPEVAEEVVWALKARDRARFELLLLKPSELDEVGFGRERAAALSATLEAAPAAFSKLAADQKVVTRATEFVDIYRSRPATIPAGTEDSTNDVTIHDNATALVETGQQHDQIYLGTLVAVGDTWKLLDVPSIGADSPPQAGLLTATAAGSDGGAAAGPGATSDEIQKLVAQLEKLDQQAGQLGPDARPEITDERADVLLRLAKAATDQPMRSEWIRQLADLLGTAIQEGNYPQGIQRLDQLLERLADQDANDPLISYVQFRRMWAQYVLSQQEPDADFGAIQKKWLADLETFANEHPQSPDAAESLLQLGMSHEFAGRLDPAKQWYQKLVTSFPRSAQSSKAAGALRRLNSVGKPLRFREADLRGTTIDLAAPPYRGKVVLIHYWATWDDGCKDDMDTLKELYARYGGRGGFEVIGVCLDTSADAMRAFLTANRYPWRQIHEPGGFDGRLANDMGVMTLPLMILVDQKGNVAADNVFPANLEGELKRLLGTATAQGTRPNPAR